MSLGKKRTFTGIVRRQRLDVGMPNERDGHVLDMGAGVPLELKLNLGSSFHAFTAAHASLERLVGKTVTVAGVEGSGLAAIFVSDIRDVKTAHPPSPRGPKP
jgi:hypothetical protein